MAKEKHGTCKYCNVHFTYTCKHKRLCCSKKCARALAAEAADAGRKIDAIDLDPYGSDPIRNELLRNLYKVTNGKYGIL